MADVLEKLAGQLIGKSKRWKDMGDGSYAGVVSVGGNMPAGTNVIGKVGIDQTTPGTTNGVIAGLYQPIVPAEVVVAGAASSLGKIGTMAAGATLFVRCPCAASAPGTSRVRWRVKCDKQHTVTMYLARTVLNAPTITLASVQANDTVVINGLTFTAHANTTTVANREFKIDGATDTLDAAELVTCINAAFGALGLSGAAPAAVVTLTATTATVTQAVTGVGGARIVCAQTFPTPLDQWGDAEAGLTAITTHNGRCFDQDVSGYPQAYLGITNNDGAAAATVVVGATALVW